MPMARKNRASSYWGGPTFLILFLVLIVSLIISTGKGYIKISPSTVVDILYRGIIGKLPDKGTNLEINYYVIWQVRLPRILTAMVVGGSLSMAGVIFQAILVNPLADPYTLGVSAGAAFGASIALLLNIPFLGIYSVSIFAFFGALLTLVTVIFLSSNSGDISSNNLILSGIIVSAILAACISFIKYIADERVSVIIFWLMGSFNSKTWIEFFVVSISTFIGFLISFYFSRDINLMTLGDRSASALGISPSRLRIILLITASMITAVSVSVSGIIGFVGLVVPHLMRFIIGPDNRKLLPVSTLAGAVILLWADTITRAFLPREIPIGVLTALIGGPFFCFIFKRRKNIGFYG